LTDYLYAVARHLSYRLLNYANVQAGRPKNLGSNPGQCGSPFLAISLRSNTRPIGYWCYSAS